jgi:GH24 family phage-related lysozyme (muramidase)
MAKATTSNNRMSQLGSSVDNQVMSTFTKMFGSGFGSSKQDPKNMTAVPSRLESTTRFHEKNKSSVNNKQMETLNKITSSIAIFAKQLPEFLKSNAASVEELQAIRKKLESENTIAVKFSSSSDSAKELKQLVDSSQKTENILSDFVNINSKESSSGSTNAGNDYDRSMREYQEKEDAYQKALKRRKDAENQRDAQKDLPGFDDLGVKKPDPNLPRRMQEQEQKRYEQERKERESAIKDALPERPTKPEKPEEPKVAETPSQSAQTEKPQWNYVPGPNITQYPGTNIPIDCSDPNAPCHKDDEPKVVPTPAPQPPASQPPAPQPPAPSPIEPTDKAEKVPKRPARDHIGYGHRLTDEELRTGKIKLPDGTELDVNKGITEEEAQKLYKHDKSKLDDLTKKTLKNKGVDLDSLPSHIQDVVKDMGFNGPKIFNKKELTDALKKGDPNEIANAVRGSLRTAEGKEMGGLVKRAEERAEAVLDPNKKIDTKKFEGYVGKLHDPRSTEHIKNPDAFKVKPEPMALTSSNQPINQSQPIKLQELTDKQKEDLTNLDKALQDSINRYGGAESKSYQQTPGLLDPFKIDPNAKKNEPTPEEMEEQINRLEEALRNVPTAQLEPTQRQTGPVLGAMETQLASAKDIQQSSGGGGGSPTIINNTTNNAGGMGSGQPPISGVRNEENSLVRVQNMIAVGAMT